MQNSNKQQKEKYQNSKYKNLSQRELNSQYQHLHIAHPLAISMNWFKLILTPAIFFGVVYGVLYLINLILDMPLVEDNPYLFIIISSIAAAGGLGYAIYCLIISYNIKVVKYFIEDKGDADKKLVERYKSRREFDEAMKEYDAQLAEKRARENETKEIAENLKEINKSLQNTDSESSSYDVYDSNGNRIGKIEKK